MFKPGPECTAEQAKKIKEAWDHAKRRRAKCKDGSVKTPEGADCLKKLDESDKTIQVNVVCGESRGSNNSRLGNGGVYVVDLYWGFSHGKLSDGTPNDLESALVHEAAHICGWISEKWKPGEEDEDKRRQEEEHASAVENQHRAASGREQRQKYGDWPVKQCEEYKNCEPTLAD